MVEVFKTDVSDFSSALRILEALHERFMLYVPNFDLEDCDHVLRVKCLVGEVDATQVILLLNEFGFNAEVLSDEIPELAIDLLR